jgi:hypothetical protein
MSKITIDSNGRIAVPQQVAREIGSRALELSSHSAQHLLLTSPDPGEPVVLSGILGELGVADLLSFFNMFRKTGVLRFYLAGGIKALYFQQGEIVFATSTFPEEDLGEVLSALGKVDQETLQKARQFATGRTTIGKILVDRKVVTPKDLWLASRNQVEAIVYHLFAFHQGSYSFVAKVLEKEEIVRLSMSTQNLIMEGLQRVDERALFLRRIPSLDLLPVPTGEKEEGLSPAEERMLQLLRQGRCDVRTTLRKSALGEFEALKLLYHLLEKGAVRLEEAAAVVIDGDLGEILSVFNGALVTLFRRVSEKNSGFEQELRTFLRDLPQPFSYVFRDVSFQGDGAVDGTRILANLAGLEEGEKKRLLADALSEVVYMECIAARRDLGVGESADLIRRVQEISRRVKTLIGRSE